MPTRKKSRSRRRRSPYGNWRRTSPKSTKVRRKLVKKRPSCFLMPDGTAKNNYRPMFPVCDKNGVYNCGGIRAARTRAAQWKYTAVKAKANKLGKRLGCSWAKKSRRKSRRKSRKKSRRKSRKKSRRKSRKKSR